MMSAPYPGAPNYRFDGQGGAQAAARLHADLAALTPPRLHYQRYFSQPDANAHMLSCEQGLHDFLRAYFHMKSADWAGNQPAPLPSASAADLASMPTYYIMEQGKTIAETVAVEMPSETEIAECRWLSESELAVYTAIFADTGLQGGLQCYRMLGSAAAQAEMLLFAGLQISVPSYFMSGASDWGTWQSPGALDAMRQRVCTDLRGCELIDGAGHWVEQEQPAAVVEALLGFLASQAGAFGEKA
tara:strand:- start:6100 stop:6831 length:732 start_codon:yes stop_codon:yes gene_type:complete